jgi:dehydrogenase/reductase SDR family protein 7B
MIGAVETNKQEVNFGGKEVIGVYIKRFFPAMFRNIVRKMQIKEAKKAK